MKYLKKILDFLGKFYDKIILGVVLVILIVCLKIQNEKLQKNQQAVQQADQDLRSKLPQNQIAELNEDALKVSLEVDESKLWQDSFGEGNLFHPGNYVFSMEGSPYLLHVSTIKSPFTFKLDVPDGAGIAGSSSVNLSSSEDDQSRDSDGDGIPDGAESEAGLDRNDPRDAAADIDGDGFDNLEEYRSKTGINDASSHPELATRLRFLKMIRDPIDIMLKKVNMNNNPDDKRVWDIFVKYKDKRLKSGFFKIGDMIPGLGYKIIDATYKEITQNQLPIEVSEIVIQKDQQKPVTLVQNKVAYSGDDTFELVFLYGKPIRIKVTGGTDFSLTNVNGNSETYKIIESGDGELTVEFVATSKRLKVGPFTADDKKRFLVE